MQSFMEIYDPRTGKRKRMNLLQDIQRKIQRVAPNPTRDMAYDTRAQQMGKPRVQGFNGVNQGAKGFLAQLAKQPKVDVNSLLRKIAQNKRYEMPRFTTNDVLSKEWFDTALNRIAVKNRMKMDLAKQQQLAKLASDAMAAQATNARTLADVYATDVNARQKEKYTNVLDNYYRKMAAVQQQKSQPQSDPLKVQKVINERLKLFSKSPNMFIPQWDELPDDEKTKALTYFAKTGEIPRVVEVDNGFLGFGAKYAVEIPSQNGGYMQTEPKTEVPYIAKLPNGIEVYDMKIAPDGKRYIKAQDGNWYEY